MHLTELTVQTVAGPTRPFRTTKGVLQGACSSPLLSRLASEIFVRGIVLYLSNNLPNLPTFESQNPTPDTPGASELCGGGGINFPATHFLTGQNDTPPLGRTHHRAPQPHTDVSVRYRDVQNTN